MHRSHFCKTAHGPAPDCMHGPCSPAAPPCPPAALHTHHHSLGGDQHSSLQARWASRTADAHEAVSAGGSCIVRCYMGFHAGLCRSRWSVSLPCPGWRPATASLGAPGLSTRSAAAPQLWGAARGPAAGRTGSGPGLLATLSARQARRKTTCRHSGCAVLQMRAGAWPPGRTACKTGASNSVQVQWRCCAAAYHSLSVNCHLMPRRQHRLKPRNTSCHAKSTSARLVIHRGHNHLKTMENMSKAT